MNRLHCKLASAVFAIGALWGGSAVHAQDVRAEQAVRKADAREAARAGENPLLGTWKLQSLALLLLAGCPGSPFAVTTTPTDPGPTQKKHEHAN
jgi:hypothetical protein